MALAALIASNDNWQHTIIGGIITSDQVMDIQSSGLCSGAAKPVCDHSNPATGTHTAIVRGKNIAVGVALVEVYDLDSGALGFEVRPQPFKLIYIDDIGFECSAWLHGRMHIAPAS